MRVVAGLVGAVALVLGAAAPVGAATVVVTMIGTVTAQGLGPDTDPHIKVGDQLTLTATFDSSTLINWGSSGYEIAPIYSHAATGSPLLTISGPDGVWHGYDDKYDGAVTAFTQNENYYLPDGTHVSSFLMVQQPVIILQGAHAAGVTGYLNPAGSSTLPNLILGYISAGTETITGGGGGAPIIDDANFPDLTPDPGFIISAGGNLYGNSTPSPGFSGIWDFADSTVMVDGVLAVPEPSIWALMVTGLGLLGAALRRRARVSTPLSPY